MKTTYVQAWKVTSRSKWKRVGTTPFAGRTTWNERKASRVARTTFNYRARRGVVYRRVVKERKVKKPKRVVSAVLPVVITADDDIGVDRVAVAIDGRVRAVDWSGADGWRVEVPCAPGLRTIEARAYDAADNGTAASVRINLRC